MFAGIGATLRRQSQLLLARLQRTTSRERALLVLLIGGAVVYAPVAALDWRTGQEDRLAEALSQRATARLAAAAARRAEAAASDDAALQDMESWGFEAANVSIARVALEQRLVAAGETAGLANARIATEDEIEVIGPTHWLGVEVQADLRWTSIFAFLDAIAAWPEGFRVTGFQYDLTPVLNPAMLQQGAAPGRTRITMAFPVDVPAAALTEEADD